MSLRFILRISFWLALFCAADVGLATPASDLQTKMDAAWAAAAKVAVRGPAEIKLLDQAAVSIRKDQAFIPASEANGIMGAMGNQESPERFGLIVGTGEKARWMVDIGFTKEGYVRDGEAKEWKADTLLQNLKDGTESGNTERTAKGVPALDVIGWVQPPVYDANAHRLVWSLALSNRGEPADAPRTINFNTFALGRDGYFSLDLITDSNSIAADKLVANDLLQSLRYAPGKRYADFDQSTDKVAAYGIGALVGVVVAKKLGLLALAGVFLLKLWKLAAIAVLAVVAGARRFFKRRGSASEAESEPASEAGSEPVPSPKIAVPPETDREE